MRTIRAPYAAVLSTLAGSRSAGIKTHASKPCCAACAATALARFPVEEQPTVSRPKRRAAVRAVATTRSLKEREGKQTASFLKYRFFRPHCEARLCEATSGVPPVALGAEKSSGRGRSSAYRHMLKARAARCSRGAVFLRESEAYDTSRGDKQASQDGRVALPQVFPE